MAGQSVADSKGNGVIYYDAMILACSSQPRAIMRKPKKPDLLRMMVQLQHSPEREVVPVTHVVRIQRRGYRGIVVEAIVDLASLDLVQQFSKAMIRDHDGG